MSIPDPGLHAGQTIDGFLVRRVTPMPNLRGVAVELDHPASGARLLHLHTRDEENLFSVTFPTPPPDDTGVPHILEHSVLAGSRRFPVKDPFFEMVKCSMATFINAMTGTDYTVYPVASNVRQDFFNLAEVYWDAVFHPMLTEATFQREGHHLELATKGDLNSDLIVKGIVFNEMKGARSSPEAAVSDLLEKKLWPDTALGRDSGGDPEHIPDLTWHGLRHYHKFHYHPGNAYIFLYGDIPTADHLKFLAPRLAELPKHSPPASIPPQPRWSQPRTVADVYSVAPGDPTEGRSFIVVSWLVGDARDVDGDFAFTALENILLGNQAAPLRKALIDSRLGEDVTHSGYGTNGVDTSFHVGLKGTESDRADAVLKVVFDVLGRVADEGVSRRQFDSAVQQLAYRYQEINSGYPLKLMGWATGHWINGADPLELFDADRHIQKLKRDFAADGQFFANLIRRRLLENPHRLTIIVRPDGQVQARKDAQFAQKMALLKRSMTPRQIEQIAEKQAELDAMLEQPNSPEALATLPRLQVRDLPPKPRHITTEIDDLSHGAVLLRSDVPANGVNYLHVSFDLSGLPAELIPYLGLYGDCVQKMGAASQNYEAIAQRVAAFTGGIGFSTAVTTRMDDPNALVHRATFTTKFLDEHADAALDLLGDLILKLDERDVHRLRDVVMQARAHQRTRPSNDGLGIAVRQAARGFNVESHINQMMTGLPQIRLYEQLAGSDERPMTEGIASIRRSLLNASGLAASFTGTDRLYPRVRQRLEQWIAEIGHRPGIAARNAAGNAAFSPWSHPPREGLAAPMNVAYCTTVMPAPHGSHPDAPLLMVAGRLLGLGYVLEEVRFKGTAYGAGCGYGAGGLWSFHSYRDPWVNRTLDVFAGAGDFVRAAPWTQDDVDRAIIGTAKEGERPIRPPQAPGTALWRHLIADTPERRESRHSAMLGATLPNVRRILIEQLESNAAQSAVCVVSSREKLEEANRQRPENALKIEDILVE